jgi:hypothetical protein
MLYSDLPTSMSLFFTICFLLQTHTRHSFIPTLPYGRLFTYLGKLQLAI